MAWLWLLWMGVGCLLSVGPALAEGGAAVALVFEEPLPVLLAGVAANVTVAAVDVDNILDTNFSGVVTVTLDVSRLSHADVTTPAAGVELQLLQGQAMVEVTVGVSGLVTLALNNTGSLLLNLSATAVLEVGSNYAAEPATGNGFLLKNFRLTGNSKICSNRFELVAGLVQMTARATGVAFASVVVTTEPVECVLLPSRRRAVTSVLDVDLRIELAVPLLLTAQRALRNLTTAQGGNVTLAQTLLATDITLQAAVFSDVDNTVVASEEDAAVTIPGVNCSGDTWSAWDSCQPYCSTDTVGVRTRSRQCPPETAQEACTSLLCATCNDGNNGGCDSNAACTADAQGARLCSCNNAFLGDGLSCTVRSEQQSLKLVARLTFNESLADVAPTSEEQARLLEQLLVLLSSVLQVTRSRLKNTSVGSSPAGLTLQLTIGKPTTAADPNAPSYAATIEALVANGEPRLVFDNKSLEATGETLAIESDLAASAADWGQTDTMYLLIVLFSVGIVCLIIMVLIHRYLSMRAASKLSNDSSVRPDAESQSEPQPKFPETADNPTTYWASSSTTNDPVESFKHFYPSSKLLGSDNFSGY